MVHKHTKTSSLHSAIPFHEVPFMASTPSNPLLYITTEDSEVPVTAGQLPSYSRSKTLSSARHTSLRRLLNHSQEESEDSREASNPVVQSETITMIDAVAKTLCGDNTPPGPGHSFHHYHARRRGSLPPIHINQRPTSNMHTMPEIDLHRGQDDQYDSEDDNGNDNISLFTKRMTSEQLPKGFNRGRRNSLMVPLPSKFDASPLIPPHSHSERSHSLSPGHRHNNRLSPIHSEAHQYHDENPPVCVPVKNLRRKSIAVLQTISKDKYERTESSLDLV